METRPSFTMRKPRTSKMIMVVPDMVGDMEKMGPEEAITFVTSLVYGSKSKHQYLAESFLLQILKKGMRGSDRHDFCKKHKISFLAFYRLRTRLMELGLVEKVKGKYYISDKFPNFMQALADLYLMVRRT